jgi:transcriptional regulator with XRE-family HTH domain
MSGKTGDSLGSVGTTSANRTKRLARLFRSKKYRSSYVSTHLRAFLAAQFRVLRGELSQSEFGQKIGKPQTVISRLENTGYGKMTISTLIDIASRLDIALIIRFVDFPTFLRLTEDMSERAFNPPVFGQVRIDLERGDLGGAEIASTMGQFAINDNKVNRAVETGSDSGECDYQFRASAVA